jgi:DNA-binding MarR family transcriptional regulator
LHVVGLQTASKIMRVHKAQESEPDLHIAPGSSFQTSPSFLITALGNKLTVSAERTLRQKLDVSLMEWRVLAVLAVEPAAPPGRIIGLVGVNKAAVSRAVNSLEQRGLVRRVGAKDHGLRTHLYLTRSGTALHARGELARHAAEGALMRGLSARDRNRLLGFLNHLMGNADHLIAPSRT